MPGAFMAQLGSRSWRGVWKRGFYATWSMSTQEKRKEKHVNSRIDTAVKIELKITDYCHLNNFGSQCGREQPSPRGTPGQPLNWTVNGNYLQKGFSRVRISDSLNLFNLPSKKEIEKKTCYKFKQLGTNGSLPNIWLHAVEDGCFGD